MSAAGSTVHTVIVELFDIAIEESVIGVRAVEGSTIEAIDGMASNEVMLGIVRNHGAGKTRSVWRVGHAALGMPRVISFVHQRFEIVVPTTNPEREWQTLVE